MKVLAVAFDPGSGKAGSAWGAVVDDGSKTVYVAHGAVPYQAPPNEVLGVVRATALMLRHDRPAPTGMVLGVESAVGYLSSKARVKAVLDVAHEAGRLHGILSTTTGGWEVMVLPANAPGDGRSWRGMLTGMARAGDADVAAMLRLQVRGMPTRTNVHARDALGLAVVVARLARAAKAKPRR